MTSLSESSSMLSDDSESDDYDNSAPSLPEYDNQSSSAEEEGSSDSEDSMLRSYHLELLRRLPAQDDLDEIMATPLFTPPVLRYAKSLAADSGSSKLPFAQYALLAGNVEDLQDPQAGDPRIFWNVAAPSSVFICGSQGSGKSHTLSCFLESCLIPSKLGKLPRPLTGIVFHYDTFISDSSGSPCEAAYLSSEPNVHVRVLCPPSNVHALKNAYSHLENVTVAELRLSESDLNTRRMLDLMSVGEGAVPLYVHVIQRILRDMRISQQKSGSHFRYSEFQRMIEAEDLTPAQLGPLRQRLETLESFMVTRQVRTRDQIAGLGSKKVSRQPKTGTDWAPKEGQLTIVDLSCPCVTPEMACSLFNICLSLFLEQDSSIGKLIALDEAHKYMGESAECATLTNTLLSTIRLQRHLGARVIISTQEPTISPTLLDLCSITVVHRFTSPDWLRVLKAHLAGVSTASKTARALAALDEKSRRSDQDELADEITTGISGITILSEDPTLELFSRIVDLRTGEALVFAPSAVVGLDEKTTLSGTQRTLKRLRHEVLRVRIRTRLTADGGRSIMAL